MTCRDGKAKLLEPGKLAQFEQIVLSHLDAAYNLARWLTRDERDAEDVVQESCLRALQYFDGYRGGDSRAWLLTIVRHTCFSWLHKNRAPQVVSFDDEVNDVEVEIGPEEQLMKRVDQQALRKALEELPLEFREVIILRELEELSYKEIAHIANIPIGTVMSRLARARKHLQLRLTQPEVKEV
jgi:RNA polymerase sigma-70 factor (ECF subfamily)